MASNSSLTNYYTIHGVLDLAASNSARQGTEPDHYTLYEILDLAASYSARTITLPKNSVFCGKLLIPDLYTLYEILDLAASD